MAWDRLDNYPREDQPRLSHIGMFLVWAVKRRLHATGEEGLDAEVVAAVDEGRVTGRELLGLLDEKLVEADLNEQGNAFATSYSGERYIRDFTATFGDLFDVADGPDNQARLEACLDARYERFLRPRPFWKFWGR